MSRVLNALAPIAVIGILIAALVALAGAADAQTGNARLRVLHASPDAPNVDVYVDGSEAISNLAFGSITDYTSVPAGAHAVKVFPTSANGTGTPVIDVPSLTLDAGKDYTVAAANVVASIEPVVLVDNNAAPAAGKAHIRVVHASPGAPNVDIFAEGAGVVVPNLPFKQASEYLPLAAGSYNLQVRVAGTTTAVVNLPGTNLEAGKVYTAFAIGLADGQPALTVKLTTDAAAQTATATPAPAATTAPTIAPSPSAALPAGGGDPAVGAGSWLFWVVGGLALFAVGAAIVSLGRLYATHRS